MNSQTLLAPVRFCWNRPGQTLGVLALLALIAAAAGVAGLSLWFEHHLASARAHADRGHNLSAIDHLKVCRTLRPDHRDVLLLSARVARRAGAWGEAERLLDRFWQLNGDEETLVLERLLLRATQGDSDAAVPLQGRIHRDDPSAPAAREALIAGLLFQYRQVEVEKQLDRWQEHEPDSTAALLLRGKLQEQRELNSDASLSYRRLLELDPEHDEVRLRLTTVLLRLSQGEEALPHLTYLRKRLPDHADVALQFAQTLDNLGRSEEAKAALDEGLRRHPDHPDMLGERGRIARRDGDTVLAETCLRRAVELDPGKTTVRYQLYLTLNQTGRRAEAEAEQEAIRRIESDVLRIKDLVEVRLKESPNDPGLYYEAAMIAQRAGLLRESHRWLQNALRVGPDHGPTHRALAVYYQEMGNPILAARHRAVAQRLGGPPRP